MSIPASPTNTQRAELDRELIRRYLTGDSRAFSEIAEHYTEKLINIAAPLVAFNRHDAEEVANDALLRAARNVPKFRGECSLSSWLHHITYNLARNRWHYNRRRRMHLTDSLDFQSDEMGEPFSNCIPDTSTEEAPVLADREAFLKLVPQCMALLKPKHRELLELRTVQNLSYVEIGERLSMNLGTVKSSIARARHYLRGYLMQRNAPVIRAA